jgi:hypothetical protein
MQHVAQDIRDKLALWELSQLQDLRGSLYSRLLHVLPQLMDCRLVERRVAHTVIPDIHTLSYAIVNELKCKDLEKVFTKESWKSAAANDPHANEQRCGADDDRNEEDDDTESVPDPKDIRDLIEATCSLSGRVKTLEKQYRACINTNLQLHNEMETMIAKMTDIYQKLSCLPSVECSEPDRLDHSPNPPAEQNLSVAEEQQPATPARNRESYPSSSEHDDKEDVATEAKRNKAKAKKRQKRRNRRERIRAAKQNQERAQTQPPTHTSPMEAPPMTKIYVGAVDPSCTSGDLSHFLMQKGFPVPERDITVLKTTWEYRSFSVELPSKNMNAVLDLQWPHPISVRPFREGSAARGGLRGRRFPRQRTSENQFYHNHHTSSGGAPWTSSTYRSEPAERFRGSYEGGRYESSRQDSRNGGWEYQRGGYPRWRP